MRRRLLYLPSANSDLLSILDYVHEVSGSLDVAEGFVARFRRRCRKLASLPGTLGTPRPDLRSDLRSFPFRGYLILFRYADDRLEVVTIVEGHRDVAKHVSRDEAG